VPGHVTSHGEADTFSFGRMLAPGLRAGDVVLLRGDLGAGKTVLARGIAVGLGVPAEEVRSPTFTLVNPYQGHLPVYHLDLYRIERAADLDELGLEEILGGDGVAIVEWGERLGAWRPARYLEIAIADLGGSERALEVIDARRGPGPSTDAAS
jgi:tRNA threonylcarbamoyladenosine biosynthesis protein TsaE